MFWNLFIFVSLSSFSLIFSLILDLSVIKTNQTSEGEPLSDYVDQTFLLLPIKIGTPSQNIIAKLSIQTQFFWMLSPIAKDFEGGYNSSLSSTYQLKKEMHYIKFSNTNINGITSRERMMIENKFDLPDLCFLLINQTIEEPIIKNYIFYYDAIIGLSISFNYYGRRYNFLGELQSSYKIQNRRFSVEINNSKGKLIIGETPEKMNKDSNHSHHHAIKTGDKNRVLYKVALDSFYITTFIPPNNILTDFHYVNQSASFSLETGTIEVPLTFFSIIRNNFILKHINNGNCKEHDDGNYVFYTCKKEIKLFDALSLVFDGWTYKLEEKDLWDINEEANNKKLLLVYKKKGNENSWNLGLAFLKKYLTMFDMDVGRIVIYFSNNNNIQ